VQRKLNLRLPTALTQKIGSLTRLTFTLNKPAKVTIRIRAATGRLVREFGGKEALMGLNTITWDGKTQSGAQVPRGIYLIEVIATDKEGRSAKATGKVNVR
jgi:flagellar hook assembly protein FlgD